MSLVSNSSIIASLLKQRHETVAVAESSTGGLISANLLAVAGASAYYAGGTVIYTRESRKIFLDLPMDKLKGLKPLTEEIAMVFAESIREALGSDWGIAELGVAGPGGTPYSETAGISVIAIAGPNPVSVKVNTGHNDRENNMQAFTQAALTLFEQTLQQLNGERK